jgi:hypothetical protein
MIIRHQSYPANYACTLGRVAMSGGDGTDFCTRVPTARHVWSLWPWPIMSDGKCHGFSRLRRLVKIYSILEAPGWSDWVLGLISGREGRRVGQIGDEILLAHVYRNEEKVTMWITPRFSFF